MDRPLSRKHAKAPESVAEQRFPARIVSSHAGGHWFESSSLHQKVPDFVRNQEPFFIHKFYLVRDVSTASQRNIFPFSESLLSFAELDTGKVSIALRCISDDLESLDRKRVTNAMVKLQQTFAELTPEERYKKRLEQEKPVLDALLSWANEMQAATVPSAALNPL